MKLKPTRLALLATAVSAICTAAAGAALLIVWLGLDQLAP